MIIEIPDMIHENPNVQVSKEEEGNLNIWRMMVLQENVGKTEGGIKEKVIGKG